MSGELKPCPFCGGEAEFETYGGTACAVTCRKCRCGTPTVSLNDGERAVEAWNRRAERTCRMGAPVDGEYRCGECGHLNRETYRADKGWYPPEYCAHCGARVVEEEA